MTDISKYTDGFAARDARYDDNRLSNKKAKHNCFFFNSSFDVISVL